MTTREILVIAGPTASGKTALAVEIALHVGGEVVNFDSVQIYRGIEIATAKPTAREKKGVPHHLIDYVDPGVNYSAADWARDAGQKIEEIESRGMVPVLVGGTGFYPRTLRQPLFDAPPTDHALRARLRDIRDPRDAPYLHRMLRRVDPALAATLPVNDYIRVMRALEFYFQTGERLSVKQQERGAAPDSASRMLLFVLNPPRPVLYEKIDRRTEGHFAAGLVDEVRFLIERGVPPDTNALGAHAYRRVCEFLRGERTLDSAIEQSKQDVRNYAKRQLTWFRKEPGAIWMDGFGDDPAVIMRLIDFLDRPR